MLKETEVRRCSVLWVKLRSSQTNDDALPLLIRLIKLEKPPRPRSHMHKIYDEFQYYYYHYNQTKTTQYTTSYDQCKTDE